jgi:anti-anti-sigma regulatory factor
MNKQNKICKITGSLTGNQPNIDKLIAAGDYDLTIDFSECVFISVPGLEWLKDMLLKAGAAGINVSFVALPPVLYKVFKVARIDSILNACGSPSTPSSDSVC